MSNLSFSDKFWNGYANAIIRHSALILVTTFLVAATTGTLVLLSEPTLVTTGSTFYASSGDGADGYHTLAEMEKITVYNPEVQSSDAIEDPQTIPTRTVTLAFEAKPGKDIWSPESIEDLRVFQERVLETSGYEEVCLLQGGECAAPLSPIAFLYPYGNETLNVLGIDGTLDALIEPNPVFATTFLDLGYDEGDNSGGRYTRVLMTFGGPLEGFDNTLNDIADQTAVHGDWVADNLFEFLLESQTGYSEHWNVYRFGAGVTEPELNSLVFGDALFAGAAVVFTFGYIWFHTQSFVVTVWGLTHILMAFPISMFVYVYAFGVGYFFLLNLTSIFVLVGVGADDIFVFLDAWKQSNHLAADSSSLHSRMAFTLRRSVRAMLVTSATTAAAFFANLASPIIQLQNFGLFTGMLIIANYILVITWFPAAVMVVTRVQRYGLGSLCQSRTAAKARAAAKPADQKAMAKMSVLDRDQPRALEKFLKDKYAPFLYRGRVAILTLCVIGTVFGALNAIQLGPEEEIGAFTPADSNLQRVVDISQDEFPGVDYFLNRVYITWGLGDLDRDARDRGDVFSEGDPSRDPDFDPSSEAAQQHIFDTCASLRAFEDIRDGEVDCVMEEFADWRNASGLPFPVPQAEFVEALLNFTEYELAGGTGKTVSRIPASFSGSPELDASTSWEKRIGFTPLDADGNGGELQYIKIMGNLVEPGWLAAAVGEPIYDRFEVWIADINDGAPAGVDNARNICDKWMRFQTELLLQSIAVNGISLSLVLAFIVLLLATKSFIVSLGAILSVAAIVINLVGLIVAYGWDLGIIESVALVVSVGLSVDYSVHLATAYVDSPEVERKDRIATALEELGISVLSAGVTTAGAAGFLLFAQIIFFYKFGVFLMSVTVLSIVFSLGGFLAFLAIWGPKGTGDAGLHGRRMGGAGTDGAGGAGGIDEEVAGSIRKKGGWDDLEQQWRDAQLQKKIEETNVGVDDDEDEEAGEVNSEA